MLPDCGKTSVRIVATRPGHELIFQKSFLETVKLFSCKVKLDWPVSLCVCILELRADTASARAEAAASTDGLFYDCFGSGCVASAPVL